MSDWLEEAIAKVRELGNLKENWNSYGAPPIDPKVILVATEYLTLLAGYGIPEPDGIVPTNRSAIQFEWTGDVNLEAEVFEDGHIEGLYEFHSLTLFGLARILKGGDAK